MSEMTTSGDERRPDGDPPLIALSTALSTPSTLRRRALAAMAVTGALGFGAAGFVGGRWSSPDSGSRTAGASTTPSTPSETASTPISPTTAPAIPPGVAALPPTTTLPSAVDGGLAPRPAATPLDAKRSAGGAAGSYSNGAYEEAPGTLLAARTTPAGIALTGYVQSWPDAANDPWSGQFPGWTAPAWCFPTGNLRVSIVTADAVGLAGSSWYAEPHGGLSVTSFAAGSVEAHPIFGVAAQVDAATTALALTTADGRTDTSAPSGGLVLLAVDGPIAQDFTVVATHADGTTATLSSTDLASSMTSADDQRACQPPAPALPAAGEQPADPVAAQAGVRAALATYPTIGGEEAVDPSTYVDDTTGVAGAIGALHRIGIPLAVDPAPATDASGTDQVGAGSASDVAVGAPTDVAVDVAVHELVFVSPTEAWFRYDLVAGSSSFIDRYGQARLVDGTWKLTRQTLCQDIALAGVECSPAVDQLLPPSAADDPRYGAVDTGRPEPMSGIAPTTAVA